MYFVQTTIRQTTYHASHAGHSPLQLSWAGRRVWPSLLHFELLFGIIPPPPQSKELSRARGPPELVQHFRLQGELTSVQVLNLIWFGEIIFGFQKQGMYVYDLYECD
jgi:hypothetical protein